MTINSELQRIWDTMLECMYVGCHTEGHPTRRFKREDVVPMICIKRLKGEYRKYSTPVEWIEFHSRY